MDDEQLNGIWEDINKAGIAIRSTELMQMMQSNKSRRENPIDDFFQEAKKRGVKGISTEGLMYLVNDVSTNLETLDQIIEKASLLINSEKEINLETLKKVSEASINKDTFELFNAIAKKDHLAADLILNSILQSGTHPLQILGFFNKAIKSIVIKNSKSSSTEPIYFPDLNNAWFVKKLSPERFSKERLQKALKILAELDSDIKGKNYSENGSLHSKLVYI
jgi:DNA polymerase III delta subunit